eukprot:s2112_g8.t1
MVTVRQGGNSIRLEFLYNFFAKVLGFSRASVQQVALPTTYSIIVTCGEPIAPMRMAYRNVRIWAARTCSEPSLQQDLESFCHGDAAMSPPFAGEDVENVCMLFRCCQAHPEQQICHTMSGNTLEGVWVQSNVGVESRVMVGIFQLGDINLYFD